MSLNDQEHKPARVFWTSTPSLPSFIYTNNLPDACNFSS